MQPLQQAPQSAGPDREAGLLDNVVVDLLCTAPRDPSLAGLPPSGSRDYLSTVLGLFDRAEHQVDVVSPFIDSDGVEQLRSWANQTRAQVRIFTRKPNAVLVEAAHEEGWQLHVYRGTPGHDEHRGFHCKFFLADEREAILGSVNLVYHNMIENLELGMFTTDRRHVIALQDVVRALGRASKPSSD